MFRSNPSNDGWKSRIRGLFGISAKDALSLEEWRALLSEADLSQPIIQRLLPAADEARSRGREGQLAALIDELVKIQIDRPRKDLPSPAAILLLGVNGAGKTTAAAKLARRFQSEGRKVLLAAADTFRAGAIDQLKVWGERIGVEVVANAPGSDPGAVVYEAWQRAASQGAILIADTAGRLHTRQPLMEELKKIIRILQKGGGDAPHESFLVLDGTVGQNALSQSREFLSAAPITGLIITKLDGTARGGGALSASLESKLPIRYIGLGEKVDDLVPFDARTFAEELFRP
jgi:fused signal recognition particle receptor